MRASEVVIPEGVKLEFQYSDHHFRHCADPSFYTEGDSHSLVAYIETLEKRVSVYCDGLMLALLWESGRERKSGAEPKRIKNLEQLIATGIDRDVYLAGAELGGRVEWVNNSWFDLYGENGEHLNSIHHDIGSAIEEAVKRVKKVEV